MIDEKIKETVLSYAAKVVAEGMNGKGDRIAMRTRDGFCVNDACVPLDALKAENLIEFPLTTEEKDYVVIARLFAKRPEIHAVLYTHAPFVCAVAKAKATIPAVLDDMTQIVGLNCKTCKSAMTDDLVNGLKKRNSVLVPSGGALTVGRTMDEAYTCALVLDKASHAYVCGSVLGGNKIINCIEAKLMNIVYQKKYSKVNQENISKREGE